jgi:hypothetical protein
MEHSGVFFGLLEISLSQGKTPQGKMADCKMRIDVHSPPERTVGFFEQNLVPVRSWLAE